LCATDAHHPGHLPTGTSHSLLLSGAAARRLIGCEFLTPLDQSISIVNFFLQAERLVNQYLFAHYTFLAALVGMMIIKALEGVNGVFFLPGAD